MNNQLSNQTRVPDAGYTAKTLAELLSDAPPLCCEKTLADLRRANRKCKALVEESGRFSHEASDEICRRAQSEYIKHVSGEPSTFATEFDGKIPDKQAVDRQFEARRNALYAEAQKSAIQTHPACDEILKKAIAHLRTKAAEIDAEDRASCAALGLPEWSFRALCVAELIRRLEIRRPGTGKHSTTGSLLSGILDLE